MEETVVNGRFQMLPSCSLHYDVTLTRQNIMFVEEASAKQQRKLVSILMDNIIGCKMYNSKLNQDVCSYFKVITLTKVKKGTRQKCSYAFRIDEHESREANNIIAENWTRMILWLITNPQLSVEELRGKEYFPPQRRFLVVINPKSGPGKSLQNFTNIIEPFLLEANIEYEAFITERAGHLTEKALTFDYSRWDAIVICSGDGLVYEFLNGIMKRADWLDVLKLPIGILPTGSGNALAASVLYMAKESFNLVNAIYVLLKGRSHPIDVFSVSTRISTVYGFLSVTWGIIADIDIESEKFRAMGPLRFQVGAVQRILKLRHYTGVFSYLPGKNLQGVESGTEISEDECTSMSLTEDIDVINENTLPKGNHTGSHGNQLPMETNEETNEETNTSSSCNQDTNVENELDSTRNHVQENESIYGPKCNLPELDDPLPEDWVTIDGEFISIVLSTMSHIGSDTHFSPGLCLGSGSLNLQYIKQGPRTRKMFQLLNAVDSGKHVDYPEVEIENIAAFRLTPEPSDVGHVCVDGELIKYEPIQGELFPSVGNVIMVTTATEGL